MRKLIFVSLLLLFFRLFSSVTVENVFETDDVSEYNRWVSEHRGEYPDLKPVYILGERVGVREGVKTHTGKTRIYEYRLYHYDDDGSLIKTEDIEGHEMRLAFSPDYGQIIIKEVKIENKRIWNM